MKKETSRLLFDKYFKLANPNCDILLKSGKVIRGVIIGYYFSDADQPESPIHHWRVLRCVDAAHTGFDGENYNEGTCIRHCDIASVTFEEDLSVLICS